MTDLFSASNVRLEVLYAVSYDENLVSEKQEGSSKSLRPTHQRLSTVSASVRATVLFDD